MSQNIIDAIHASITIIAMPFFWAGMLYLLYRFNDWWNKKNPGK